MLHVSYSIQRNGGKTHANLGFHELISEEIGSGVEVITSHCGLFAGVMRTRGEGIKATLDGFLKHNDCQVVNTVYFFLRSMSFGCKVIRPDIIQNS